MKRIYHNCEINNRVENFLMDVLLIKPFDGSFKCVFFFCPSPEQCFIAHLFILKRGLLNLMLQSVSTFAP